MILLQILFWTSLLLIAHSYLLFPAILRLLARTKSTDPPPAGAGLPSLSVLIAAHNEEALIARKIETVFNAAYSEGEMEVLVGSDASTDGTNRILESLRDRHPHLRVTVFSQRTGKPGVINKLAEKAEGEVLVITDANVMLEKETLRALARPFTHPETGLVDTRMIHTRIKKDGISHQEKFYIHREVRIKHHESILWGTMMGPFGGCYAVRRSCYRPVPANFLVDDFFINMSVLQQGYRCISQMEARVFEDVSNDLGEEYRRKRRISAGNFQNLARFRSLLVSSRPGLSFCFISHKVIRWCVPLLVGVTGASSAILAGSHPFYLGVALMHLGILLLPLIDHFLRKLGIHSIPLRFISHFIIMNLALLAGFFRYAGGIRSNVWQPTKRNQD